MFIDWRRHNIVIMSIFPKLIRFKHLQLSRQNNGSPREVLILSLWTCEYIMWCSKKELKFQVELKAANQSKVGRVFWIIWMDPIQPEASLNEGKRMQKSQCQSDQWERLDWPFLAPKRGGITRQWPWQPLETGKCKENEFFLEPPENNATLPTPWFSQRYPFWTSNLQKCKIINHIVEATKFLVIWNSSNREINKSTNFI